MSGSTFIMCKTLCGFSGTPCVLPLFHCTPGMDHKGRIIHFVVGPERKMAPVVAKQFAVARH